MRHIEYGDGYLGVQDGVLYRVDRRRGFRPPARVESNAARVGNDAATIAEIRRLMAEVDGEKFTPVDAFEKIAAALEPAKRWAWERVTTVCEHMLFAVNTELGERFDLGDFPSVSCSCHDETIVCPACGSRGPFRHLERVWVYRNVLSTKAGTAQVRGVYATGEGYDDGTDESLECHAEPGGKFCGHRWPVPASLRVEFD